MIQKSGYIEVNVGGRLVAFKFGMGSFAKFCELQNISLSKMGDVLSDESPLQIQALINLLYAAAYTGEKLKNKEIDFTPEHVGEWLDDLAQDDLNRILATMSQARIMGKSIEPAEQKKTKK